MISLTERARNKLKEIANSEDHSPMWDIVFMGFG